MGVAVEMVAVEVEADVITIRVGDRKATLGRLAAEKLLVAERTAMA